MESIESITFRGFDSEQDHSHLMDYLRDTLVATLDAFVPSQRHHLDLKLQHSSPRGNHRNQLFECEAIAWVGGIKNPIVIRRSDRNFYAAVNACNIALRNCLAQKTRARERSRVITRRLVANEF